MEDYTETDIEQVKNYIDDEKQKHGGWITTLQKARELASSKISILCEPNSIVELRDHMREKGFYVERITNTPPEQRKMLQAPPVAMSFGTEEIDVDEEEIDTGTWEREEKERLITFGKMDIKTILEDVGWKQEDRYRIPFLGRISLYTRSR